MARANARVVLLAGIYILAAVAFSRSQQDAAASLRTQNELLRMQADALASLREDNLSLKQAWVNEWARFQKEQVELAQLRDEAAHLHWLLDVNVASAAPFYDRAPVAEHADSEEDAISQQIDRDCLLRLSTLQRWMKGFLKFAGLNEGLLPRSFDEAEEFVAPADEEAQADAGQLEIVYQGPVNELADPSTRIVIQEKAAHATPDGRWSKAYVFADGHAQVHISALGDFEDWERGQAGMAAGLE